MTVDILSMLHGRHTEDVFIAECRNGPANKSLCIMDAWAIAKSYAHPHITAYEIKMSRKDFLRDEKWQSYLKYCHQLYWACPNGLIRPDEVPAETGLLWAASTGSRLFIKKKAQYRKIDPLPEEFYWYLLFSRVKVMREYWQEGDTKRDTWVKWLAKRDEDKELGQAASHKIRELVEKKIAKVETENIKLKKENERLAEFKEAAREMGISVIGGWTDTKEGFMREIQRELERLAQAEAVTIRHLLNVLKEVDGKMDEIVKRTCKGG